MGIVNVKLHTATRPSALGRAARSDPKQQAGGNEYLSPVEDKKPYHFHHVTDPAAGSIILRRKFIVNVTDQADPHLGGIIASQHIADEVCLNLHLHHFECTPQHAAEDVRIPELVLCATVVGQLNEVGERILLEDQRELFTVARPVCYGRCYVEEDLEADLDPCRCQSLPAVAPGIPSLCSSVRGRYLSVRTLEIISAVSRKFAQRFIVFDLAR